jgi:hypothetical protein
LSLLKTPLGRKILDFGGIKSPSLYRENPSTGILERLFLSPEYDLLQCWKRGVFQQNQNSEVADSGTEFLRKKALVFEMIFLDAVVLTPDS